MNMSALALALCPLLALAATQKTGDAKAGFEAKGPAGFALKGVTKELELADDGTTLTITVPLANLETGIGLRDHHMREKYLQVKDYPSAVLQIAWAEVHLPDDGKVLSGRGTGQLSIHGVTKTVGVSYLIKRRGTECVVSGAVTLNLKDFGVEVPSYMGLTVQPDIVVSAHFTATHG